MAAVMRPLRWPRFWLGLWIAAILAVVALSLIPPPPMPFEPPRNFDKLEHLLAYAALAFCAVQLFAQRHALVLAATGLVALGIALEFAQGLLVPGLRQMDAADALANTLGVALGMACAATPLARTLQRLEARMVRR